MELKVFILLCLATVSFAGSVKKMTPRDMMTSEGRSLHSYAAPPSRYVGGATVTSYHRRGNYAQASELSKPSIYGSSYAAPAPRSIGSSSYRSAPVGGYAPAPRYPAPELAPAAHGYGPQRNAYSEESRHASQDPHYDPAKDPVSQYAAYIPVFEYAPKSRSQGSELSLYGYRK